MSDINHVVFTGRLTSDAQVKDFENSSIFSGSIAVNRYNKKEQKEEADFFNFKVWSSSPKQTEFYKANLVKGSAVVLDGTLQVEKWEKDGQKQSRVVVLANSVAPMGGKRGGESSDSGFPSE